MIHPHTRLVKIDDKIGVGIVATNMIPKGTITWCRDELDFILRPRATKALPKKLQNHFLIYAHRNDSGDYLLNWDNGRYQNHSCEPTSCLLPNLECEIALRDIDIGEQISSDYATYNLDNGFTCECGMESCRSKILPSQKHSHFKELRPMMLEALQFFDDVAQPLKDISEHFPKPGNIADRSEKRWSPLKKMHSALSSVLKKTN